MTDKRCTKCEKIKKPSEFYADAHLRDGRSTQCKVCRNKNARVYRNRPEIRKKLRTYFVRYRQRPEVAAKIKTRSRNYKQDNQPKIKAHATINNAIQAGRLVRQPCEICNKPNAEAHHDDYTQPLRVRWLCHKHHVQHHHPPPTVGATK